MTTSENLLLSNKFRVLPREFMNWLFIYLGICVWAVRLLSCLIWCTALRS